MHDLKLSDLPALLRSQVTNWDMLREGLTENYGQSWRKYHNIGHLLWMLRKAESLSSHVRDPLSMQVAILFHDIIYDVMAPAGQNEQMSVVAAGLLAPKCISGVNMEAVSGLIMATCHAGNEVEHDEELMADIDLGSLTLPYPDFRKQSEAIIDEYCTGYQRHQVLAGRAQFLKGMLVKEKLFYTSHFSDKMARENIQKEIEYLEGC